MADLRNLLDELNEDEPDVFDNAAEEVNQEDPAQQRNDERQTPEVPPALLEAERNRFRPIQDDSSQPGDHDDTAKSARNDTVAEEETEDADYAQLKRFWIQEMNCPEIFPRDSETVSLHMELLQGQEESIDKLLEQAADAREQTRKDSSLASLVASICKMDADRVRFMLTDVTRTRLAKIEQHALYMREMVDRMSEEEVAYLMQYGELYERHLRRSVLDHLPKDAFKKLDEPEMIDSPDLDEFVFCKVMETVEIDNRDSEAEEDADDLAVDNIQEHQEGACLIARYSAVKNLVLEGKIELLM